MNVDKEMLLNIVDKIVKNNILTKQEFKAKVASVLIRNNDSRKLEGMTENLWEGGADNLKSQDVEGLIFELNNYIDATVQEKAENKLSDEFEKKKRITENQKISELYNDSIIKIQNLQKELDEKKGLEVRIDELESKLKRYKTLDIDQILLENKMYSRMFKITGTKPIEVPDEDIDALYVRYKAEGVKEYGKAFVTENGFIPKIYYDTKGGR